MVLNKIVVHYDRMVRLIHIDRQWTRRKQDGSVNLTSRCHKKVLWGMYDYSNLLEANAIEVDR